MSSVQYATVHAFQKVLWKWKSEGLLKDIPEVKQFPHSCHLYVSKLLGLDYSAPFDPILEDKLGKLCGPHGYALFRVILARQHKIES